MKQLLLLLLSLQLYALEILQEGENTGGIYIKKLWNEVGEQHLGILEKIPNSGYLQFDVQNRTLICKSYGIISIHEILFDQNATQRCRSAILNYFHHHPKEYYFADYHLHLQQMYHLELKEQTCIIYSRGSVSYARELLEAGLAKVKKGFNDLLLQKKYRDTELMARHLRLGIFKSNIPLNCRTEFRK